LIFRGNIGRGTAFQLEFPANFPDSRELPFPKRVMHRRETLGKNG
jgi:hypothetical protein